MNANGISLGIPGAWHVRIVPHRFNPALVVVKARSEPELSAFFAAVRGDSAHVWNSKRWFFAEVVSSAIPDILLRLAAAAPGRAHARQIQ